MDAKITGKLIQDRRKALGLTQLQLAEKLNISNRAISKWENGDGFPDITLLPELAGVLGITIDELLTGVKPEKEIEYITVEVEKNELDYKKVKSRLMISEIIAFCLSFLGTVIGTATEIMMFHTPLFYAFIEIYLIVAMLAMLVVAVIVMLTGIVRYNIEANIKSPKQIGIIFLFFLMTSFAPACFMFRAINSLFIYGNGFLYRYIFSGVYIVAIIISTIIVAKKIKGLKNDKSN